MVGQTRKLIFGATTLQDRAIKAKLKKLQLNPTNQQIEIIRSKIKEKLRTGKFISEKEFEDIAKEIID